MHVFVTGASGWVGSEVSRQLRAAGHTVTGLARSDKSAAALEAAGVAVRRGELGDPDSLAAGARAADAVIHCAFIHDFSDRATAVAADRNAIEAMGKALAGTGRPFLITSGTAGLKPTDGFITEETLPGAVDRGGTETFALAFADQNVRVGVIRLPPSVHGDGDHGFVPALIGIARDKGAAAYIGTGDNRWSAVHRNDAARAYVLALEKGVAGARYHAVGDEGIPFREIAAVIGRKLGLPVVSVAQADAAAQLGWMGMFAGLDVPASSRLTSERLGWQPAGRGLLADLEQGTYFAA